MRHVSVNVHNVGAEKCLEQALPANSVFAEARLGSTPQATSCLVASVACVRVSVACVRVSVACVGVSVACVRVSVAYARVYDHDRCRMQGSKAEQASEAVPSMYLYQKYCMYSDNLQRKLSEA